MSDISLSLVHPFTRTARPRERVDRAEAAAMGIILPQVGYIITSEWQGHAQIEYHLKPTEIISTKTEKNKVVEFLREVDRKTQGHSDGANSEYISNKEIDVIDDAGKGFKTAGLAMNAIPGGQLFGEVTYGFGEVLTTTADVAKVGNDLKYGRTDIAGTRFGPLATEKIIGSLIGKLGIKDEIRENAAKAGADFLMDKVKDSVVPSDSMAIQR